MNHSQFNTPVEPICISEGPRHISQVLKEWATENASIWFDDAPAYQPQKTTARRTSVAFPAMVLGLPSVTAVALD